MSERRTAVLTAQCWYDGAMDRRGDADHRAMCAINAFNHTENALFALADKVVACAGGAGDNELLEMAQRYCSDRKCPKTMSHLPVSNDTPSDGIMREKE